jgi:lantibiotic biosynthesis protein
LERLLNGRAAIRAERFIERAVLEASKQALLPDTTSCRSAQHALLQSFALTSGCPSASQSSVERGLSCALEVLAREHIVPWLDRGLAALALSLHLAEPHVRPRLFHGVLPALDRTLAQLVRTDGRRWRSELLQGLTGVGAYLLCRRRYPDAERGLRAVIRHLGVQSKPLKGGRAWGVSGAAFAWSRRLTRVYPLGMAHGAAGVASFLATVVRAGFATTRAAGLLNESVGWLLEQKMPRGGARFPRTVPGPLRRPPNRPLSWCWGDLGIAAALFKAGRVLGNERCVSESLHLASALAALGPDVVRGSLAVCHGAAGAAHVFNRFYQATRRETFRSAALVWYDRALDMCESPAAPWAEDERASAGMPLLGGSAGVALAFLTALGGAPDWDRMLQVDVD